MWLTELVLESREEMDVLEYIKSLVSKAGVEEG